MKNLINLLILLVLIFVGDLRASDCNWKSTFKYPQHGKTYEAGADIHALIVPVQKNHIASIDLYLNGKFIRKETSHPFEWCRGSGSTDKYLRNLKAGTYKLKAKIRDKCGGIHWVECTFYVREKFRSGREGRCSFNNPLKDLPWLKKLHQQYPDYIIALHNKKGRPLFRLYPCNKNRNYWYDCEGNRLSNHQSGARLVKYIYKDCSPKVEEPNTNENPSGGKPQEPCETKGWFKYPKNNGTYRYGKDVYVRFDVAKYKDIEFVELYVNGKFVRKDTSFPFEWCKYPGKIDSLLRNLKRGTFNLKARLKTKCGDWSEESIKFYVR